MGNPVAKASKVSRAENVVTATATSSAASSKVVANHAPKASKANRAANVVKAATVTATATNNAASSRVADNRVSRAENVVTATEINNEVIVATQATEGEGNPKGIPTTAQHLLPPERKKSRLAQQSGFTFCVSKRT